MRKNPENTTQRFAEERKNYLGLRFKSRKQQRRYIGKK